MDGSQRFRPKITDHSTNRTYLWPICVRDTQKPNPITISDRSSICRHHLVVESESESYLEEEEEGEFSPLESHSSPTITNVVIA